MLSPSTESKLRDVGLLILRLGFGGMFAIQHGWGKIVEGPDGWTKLGASMGLLGVSFSPVFWGFMSAFAEFVGGLCIASGLFFRLMCAMLTFNMFVAAMVHYHNSSMRPTIAVPIQMGVIAFCLLLTGAGNLSLGKLLFGGKKSSAGRKKPQGPA
jgi:putative oxidoreductase